MDLMDFDMLFPLTLTGVLILALVAIGCLSRCRGKNRRHLAWAAGVFLTALVLFFGGLILLGFFRMTWRSLPSMILLGTLLVSGWMGIVLTMGCFLPMEWPGIPAPLRWVSKGAALLFATVVILETLWFGPLLIVWGFGGEERVVEYEGKTLLEVDESFLEPDYRYYLYHGPLVRGTERLYHEYEPLDRR